jgi:uncharacterized protein (TIGR02246 family)
MKIRKNLPIVILALITNFVLINNVCAKNDDEPKSVRNAFDIWLVAVSSHNAEKVAELYESDAILLPTLSSKVKELPEQRLQYFKKFTALPEIKGTVNEILTRVYGDIGINSGTYTFTYQKDGKTIIVPSRFSFVYQRTDKGWMIVDHHSSKMPEDSK